jgi:hypothetical protein
MIGSTNVPELGIATKREGIIPYCSSNSSLEIAGDPERIGEM